MSVEQAGYEAEAVARALNTANVSLRIALARIEEVTDRFPQYAAGLRDVTTRGIALMRGGDTEDRYHRIRGTQQVAQDVSDDIRRGRGGLDEAEEALRRGQAAIETADDALTRLQSVDGHDERLAATLSERANLLRGATNEALYDVRDAGARLDGVRDNLNLLDRDGYLQSQMEPMALSHRTTEAGLDATRDLSVAEARAAQGTGRLQTVRVTADAAEADSARLAAQKGLNPPVRADQEAPPGQGAQDLRARLGATLDGGDRERG